MLWILAISVIFSFLVTLFICPYFINFLTKGGVVALDLNKRPKRKLPTSGGVPVGVGIIFGLLLYIGLTTFTNGISNEILNLLAVISSILIITFVGFLDDLNVNAKATITKEGLDIRIGFPQWIKPLLTLPAAIPLMVVNVGETVMAVPFIGNVNFGIFYPMILIPIGVVGASNMINLLGGFNGSETGMGIIYTLGLGIFALLSGNVISVVFLAAFGALMGFIKYNWYPAKFLPGDSLTYLLGSIVASGVIVGNLEKIGIIMLFPFIVEFLLKARSKFQASCLGKLNSDGRLDPPYGKKIYSITHLIMNLKPMTEKQVTLSLILIELIFALIPFLYII